MAGHIVPVHSVIVKLIEDRQTILRRTALSGFAIVRLWFADTKTKTHVLFFKETALIPIIKMNQCTRIIIVCIAFAFVSTNLICIWRNIRPWLLTIATWTATVDYRAESNRSHSDRIKEIFNRSLSISLISKTTKILMWLRDDFGISRYSISIVFTHDCRSVYSVNVLWMLQMI